MIKNFFECFLQYYLSFLEEIANFFVDNMQAIFGFFIFVIVCVVFGYSSYLLLCLIRSLFKDFFEYIKTVKKLKFNFKGDKKWVL